MSETLLIIELIKLFLANNDFTFNDEWFLQVGGTAKGKKFGSHTVSNMGRSVPVPQPPLSNIIATPIPYRLPTLQTDRQISCPIYSHIIYLTNTTDIQTFYHNYLLPYRLRTPQTDIHYILTSFYHTGCLHHRQTDRHYILTTFYHTGCLHHRQTDIIDITYV